MDKSIVVLGEKRPLGKCLDTSSNACGWLHVVKSVCETMQNNDLKNYEEKELTRYIEHTPSHSQCLWVELWKHNCFERNVFSNVWFRWQRLNGQYEISAPKHMHAGIFDRIYAIWNCTVGALRAVAFFFNGKFAGQHRCSGIISETTN